MSLYSAIANTNYNRLSAWRNESMHYQAYDMQIALWYRIVNSSGFVPDVVSATVLRSHRFNHLLLLLQGKITGLSNLFWHIQLTYTCDVTHPITFWSALWGEIYLLLHQSIISPWNQLWRVSITPSVIASISHPPMNSITKQPIINIRNETNQFSSSWEWKYFCFCAFHDLHPN